MGDSLTRAIAEAVEGGQWILGPQVAALEERLASVVNVKHAVACANGTDALLLVLKAWDIGPGDAVFVPAFTFAATAEVVALAGASPVFVDVEDDTFNISLLSLETALAMVRREGALRPRAVIPVDLFGQPADYNRLEPFIEREKLLMLCDAAQAFGASFHGRSTGSIGHAATTSFFPAKPLGCYGDGGACFTNDSALADALRSLRMHGQGADRYEHPRIGLNSRLDTIQAAILLGEAEDLPRRGRDARGCRRPLQRASREQPHPHAGRDRRRAIGLGAVHDPGRQPREAAGRSQGSGHPDRGLLSDPVVASSAPTRTSPPCRRPTARALSERVVSLPMHPYLDEKTQDRIIEAVLKSVA